MAQLLWVKEEQDALRESNRNRICVLISEHLHGGEGGRGGWMLLPMFPLQAEKACLVLGTWL